MLARKYQKRNKLDRVPFGSFTKRDPVQLSIAHEDQCWALLVGVRVLSWRDLSFVLIFRLLQ